MLDDLRPERLFSLEGRVVLLTGAAGGIGTALGRGFAAAGATVVLADRDVLVEDRAQALRDEGAEAESLVFDITDADAVDRAFAHILGRFGQIDVAVNNAAALVRKHFLDMTLDEWRKVIDTDVTACFAIAQRAARAMRQRGSGRIINMSSIMNQAARPHLSAYVTAKGAMAAMTRALAADLAGTGITVDALAPGYTATPFSMASNAEFHDFVAGWTPTRRWAKPDDICGPALLLASDAGAYINGTVLYVDGGFLAVTK